MITLNRTDWIVAPPATVVAQVKDVEDTEDCEEKSDRRSIDGKTDYVFILVEMATSCQG